MNDEDPRQVQFPLDFLTTDTPYAATIFSDIKGSRDAQRQVVEITSAGVLDVAMEPRGGLAVIVESSATP